MQFKDCWSRNISTLPVCVVHYLFMTSLSITKVESLSSTFFSFPLIRRSGFGVCMSSRLVKHCIDPVIEKM